MFTHSCSKIRRFILTATVAFSCIVAGNPSQIAMADATVESQITADGQQLSAQKYLALRNTLDGKWREDDVTIIGVGPCPDGHYLVTMKSMTKPGITYYPKLLNEAAAPHIGMNYRVLFSTDSSTGSLMLLAHAAPAEVSELEQQITSHDAKALASKKTAIKPQAVIRRPTTRLVSRHNTNASYMPVYPAYLKAIRGFNPRLSDEQAELITHSLLSYSQMFGVDPRLVVAMILAESRFRPDAISRVGATGLGQLMPRTANGLGVGNPLDPRQNLYGSIKLLRGHLGNYAAKVGAKDAASWKHIVLTMAAYNAGARAVKKYGGVPPYKETQAYVSKVIGFYRQLCAGD